MTNQTKKIAQLVRHFLVPYAPSEAVAWSPVAETIADALTDQYFLVPRPAVPDPAIRGMHYQVPVEGLTDDQSAMASTWTSDDPEVAERHAALHGRLAAGYQAIAARLTSDQQDAEKLAETIRREQRHKALCRILPEAAAANNLPAWDDLDLMQQRAVDQVVELTNALNSSATRVNA